IVVEYEAEDTWLEIDVTSSDLRQTQVNGYIVDWMEAKRKRTTHDKRQWKEYIQSFKEWKIDTFKFANEQACNDLRDFLRTNGVFVNSDTRTNVATALVEVLKEIEPYPWTKASIEDVLEDFPNLFHSRHNPCYADQSQGKLGNISPVPSRNGSEDYQLSHASNTHLRDSQPLNNRFQTERVPVDQIKNLIDPQRCYPGVTQKNQNSERQSYSTGVSMPQQPQYNQHQNPTGYSSANLVPQNINSMLGKVGRELGTSQRTYQPDMQYGGTDDDFDLCLKIYYDQCRKVGILPHVLGDAFSVMLKGRTREYYYDRIADHIF
ncbi:integrase and RNaseH domain-containing protein, partial [Golovinomyces cichoracearum]